MEQEAKIKVTTKGNTGTFLTIPVIIALVILIGNIILLYFCTINFEI